MLLHGQGAVLAAQPPCLTPAGTLTRSLHLSALPSRHSTPRGAGAGRSWMAAPKDKSRAEAEQCFLPKRHIHTWSGHSKGVNAIRCARQRAVR